MTKEEALLALKHDTDAAEAIVLGRDSLKADDELWRGILDYFSQPRPDSVVGFFAGWFCQTLTRPQRGLEALQTIFSQLAPAAQKATYLSKLEAALAERRFSLQRRWLALQGSLLCQLARGWCEQPTHVESYGCTHNTVLAFARVFLPVLEPGSRPPLAQLCLEAVQLHDRPPTHSGLHSFPDPMIGELSEEAVPLLLDRLERGLVGSAGMDLRPYKRKRDRWSACDEANLQLCLQALITMREHPEWEERICQEAPPRQIPQEWLGQVVELLDGLWDLRWKRLPQESLPAYLARQAPLGALTRNL